MVKKEEKKTKKKTEAVEEKSEEIWDGKQFVTMESLLEQVANEMPTISMKKDELAKQILSGLLMGDPRVTPAEYNRISKECKSVNEISQGPSLHYMVSNGYMNRIKIEGKRAFYVITKKGADFADFQKGEESEEPKTEVYFGADLRNRKNQG